MRNSSHRVEKQRFCRRVFALVGTAPPVFEVAGVALLVAVDAELSLHRGRQCTQERVAQFMGSACELRRALTREERRVSCASHICDELLEGRLSLFRTAQSSG